MEDQKTVVNPCFFDFFRMNFGGIWTPIPRRHVHSRGGMCVFYPDVLHQGIGVGYSRIQDGGGDG